VQAALKRAHSQPRLHDKVLRSTSSRRPADTEQLPMREAFHWPHLHADSSAVSGYESDLQLASGHGDAQGTRALFSAAHTPHPTRPALVLGSKGVGLSLPDSALDLPAGVAASSTASPQQAAGSGTTSQGKTGGKSVRFGAKKASLKSASPAAPPVAPPVNVVHFPAPEPEWSPTRREARASVAALLQGRPGVPTSPALQAAQGPSAGAGEASSGAPLTTLPRPAPVQTETELGGAGPALVPPSQAKAPSLWGRIKGVFTPK